MGRGTVDDRRIADGQRIDKMDKKMQKGKAKTVE
jgi:hypothetical protein